MKKFLSCFCLLMIWGIAVFTVSVYSETTGKFQIETLGNPPSQVGRNDLIRMNTDPKSARIPELSWDTEGGSRADANLLRKDEPLLLRIQSHGKWQKSSNFPANIQTTEKGTTYKIQLTVDSELIWNLHSNDNNVEMSITARGSDALSIEKLEMVFPFNPEVTPTTVIPHDWAADGTLVLPAVISAPDFGQLLLTALPNPNLKAHLLGSRTKKTVDFILELPKPAADETTTICLSPVWLSAPKGLEDTELWCEIRRGWCNEFQPSAQWGDSGNPFSAPAGMLANNVISDPASCSIWFYADQALWTPNITPDISIMALVRRTVNWWLDERTRPNGEVVCYWDKLGFLDANAGPIIAAWDYVEAAADRNWLESRIEKLEFISEYLAKRDIDGDGLVEAVQSGNRNTLLQPGRSCAWWDALNCGHKDGYTNALIYRAWRCLADLESLLNRTPQQERYTQLADRLQSAYYPTLFNPKTGWLAWWKSADGELHDYASPTLNGLAIEYGLVEPEIGRQILSRLREKMRAVGFKRSDLGVPPMLIPVPRFDYLQPDAVGLPKREDGTDTFGQYMNGGITAGQVLHYIAAYYTVGEQEIGDSYLFAMLRRQAKRLFQNGVQDAGGKGIDWTDWNGKPCGYEGYLADNFRFLQACLLREPELNKRYYRPLIMHK